MSTINGLPAHILLVHAMVVLLPLAALLLVLCVVWPTARRYLAGPNAVLSLVVLALTPVTTDAGEWLETRVKSTALIRDHVEVGDTALYVAIPVAVLALVVWWRGREINTLEQRGAEADPPAERRAGTQRRALLAPASAAVGVVIAVVSVLAAGAAAYDAYLMGDSGAKATWTGEFSPTPLPEAPGER